MKKLQNNYTTPEQSKRLLELGVPAYSADCVLENLDTAENDFKSKDYTRWIIEKRHAKEDIFCERNEGIFLPCWSGCRLMEIITIRHLSGDGRFCFVEDMCESLVGTICRFVKYGEMDFSKLEE